MIPRHEITGLVLDGGRGIRMGGIDKGLVRWRGEPLVRHAARRLAPQVGQVAISANRQLEVHAEAGYPVWPDTPIDGGERYAGPLVGILTGLERAPTPFLACVPCDAPAFPEDLVTRLAEALAAAAAPLAIAMAAHGQVWRPEPVFCLVHRGLAADLRRFIEAGGRKVGEWAARQHCTRARFADANAFVNLNTPADLAAAGSFSRASSTRPARSASAARAAEPPRPCRR